MYEILKKSKLRSVCLCESLWAWNKLREQSLSLSSLCQSLSLSSLCRSLSLSSLCRSLSLSSLCRSLSLSSLCITFPFLTVVSAEQLPPQLWLQVTLGPEQTVCESWIRPGQSRLFTTDTHGLDSACRDFFTCFEPVSYGAFPEGVPSMSSISKYTGTGSEAPCTPCLHRDGEWSFAALACDSLMLLYGSGT